MSVIGLLGAGGVLFAADKLIDRVAGAQGAVVKIGIKAAGGYLLMSKGKKFPIVGRFAEAAGGALLIIAAKEAFEHFAAPSLNGLPVVGQLFGNGAGVQQLPAAGVAGLVDVPYNSPIMAGYYQQ
jgi:hypothetical protein